MAVEARHLNLLPSQLMVNGESLLSNPMDNNVTTYGNQMKLGGVIPIAGTRARTSCLPESLLPFYSSLIGDGAFLQRTKRTPLKEVSCLTYNKLLPIARKRSRESAMATPINNAPLLSVPTTSRNGSNLCTTMTSSFSFLGEDVSLQIMQQKLELDYLISSHMEKVRIEAEQCRRMQSRQTAAAIQHMIMKRLLDMEKEIEEIGKLNWALEEKLKSLCLENHIWRDLARTNEAAANALRDNLEQVLSRAMDERIRSPDEADTAVDDVASCCGSSGCGGDKAEGEQQRWRKIARATRGERLLGDRNGSGEKTGHCGGVGKSWNFHGRGNSGSNKTLCKKCGLGESSVLLLPCRHLCLCTGCGPSINACPICNSVKSASIHVNLP